MTNTKKFYSTQHTPAPQHTWLHTHVMWPHPVGYMQQTLLGVRVPPLAHPSCCRCGCSTSHAAPQVPLIQSWWEIIPHGHRSMPQDRPTPSLQLLDAGCSLHPKGKMCHEAEADFTILVRQLMTVSNQILYCCSNLTPRSLPTVENVHTYTASQTDSFVSKVSS